MRPALRGKPPTEREWSGDHQSFPFPLIVSSGYSVPYRSHRISCASHRSSYTAHLPRVEGCFLGQHKGVLCGSRLLDVLKGHAGNGLGMSGISVGTRAEHTDLGDTLFGWSSHCLYKCLMLKNYVNYYLWLKLEVPFFVKVMFKENNEKD